VDNSTAAAAATSESEKPNTELELTALLIALERDRGKELAIDRSRDRTHVLTWVGKGVTAEQLRAAHALAAAARKRDTDERPTYAGFVATFIDQVLAPPARKPPPRLQIPMSGTARSPESRARRRARHARAEGRRGLARLPGARGQGLARASCN
jgi:hypothetical protein